MAPPWFVVGPLVSVRGMLSHMQSIWTFRHFWMALVKMDLRTKYRRSVLGIGWSVLNPIMMSAVLIPRIPAKFSIASTNRDSSAACGARPRVGPWIGDAGPSPSIG